MRSATLAAEGGSVSKSLKTPMMQQYLRLKAQAGSAVLFFRMGDFYELFLDDAEKVAPLLDLVLTTRDRDEPNPVPMCGVPFHAGEGYIRRLLEAGISVAVAEQVEDPKLTKGLVRREIVEVASPGLVANADRLSDGGANYIAAAIGEPGRGYGLAHLDLSTGEFAMTEVEERPVLEAEVARIAPREIVTRDADKTLGPDLPLRTARDRAFDPRRVVEEVGRLPEGLDAADGSLGARAAAALWQTVAESQPQSLDALRRVRRYVASDRMVLDPSTRRHLELVQNMGDGGRAGTLVERLDSTCTPMGRRLLVQWVGEPLLDPSAIRARQERLAEWLEPDSRRRALADALRGVGDLERMLTRACLPASGPRELAALRESLHGVARVQKIAPCSRTLDGIRERLEAVLVDEPAAAPRGEPHTGYIRADVDSALDGVRADAAEGQTYLETLEVRERERLGIPTLRLKYNRVFGYAIEVTKAHIARVPDEYVRKQTTANAERYTTDELQHWEGQVLRGRELAAAEEARVLADLRAEVTRAVDDIRIVADEIGALDVLQSLAEVARSGDYVRPVVDDSAVIEIEAGRHPVAERFTPDGFVPNDVFMDGSPEDASAGRFLILTGPNMAGKSTLLRQVGLISLLAQIGAWVPARSARLGVTDRIFTRVGASDSLATGESTFMVEMRETAVILEEATARSLVLLDEIGRGTSTFDGLSIAWAVAEYLHDAAGLRCRALFATHYHELADLARTKDGVENFHFAVEESGNAGSGNAEDGQDVLFLRKMEPGAASRSYGIEVARHAGLPPEVVRRARGILLNLEGGELDERGKPRLARQANEDDGRPEQLPLFGAPPDPVREALRRLAPNDMTPLEALVELDRLKRLSEDEG